MQQGDYKLIDDNKRIHWLLSSFLGLFFMSIGNFLLSKGFSHPSDLKLIVSLGHLFFLLTLGAFHMLILYLHQSSFPSLYPHSIYSQEKGLIPGFAFGILTGILIFFAQLSMILGWHFDPEGSSLTFFMNSAIPPFTSLLAFVVFREKLKIMQILGMIVAMIGLIVLGVDKVEGDSWESYCCGICSLALFSVRNLCSRAAQNRGIGIYPSTMLTSAGEVACGGVLLIIMVISQLFTGFFDVDWTLFAGDWTFLSCSIGAVLLAYGQYFITRAIMTGVIGVVAAIINNQGIMFLLMDLLFCRKLPGTISLIAISVMILGVITLLIGDSLLAKIKNKKDYDR